MICIGVFSFERGPQVTSKYSNFCIKDIWLVMKSPYLLMESSNTNPHWSQSGRMQDTQKVLVWCGMWYTRGIGAVFVDGILTGELIHPLALNEGGDFNSFNRTMVQSFRCTCLHISTSTICRSVTTVMERLPFLFFYHLQK